MISTHNIQIEDQKFFFFSMHKGIEEITRLTPIEEEKHAKKKKRNTKGLMNE